MVFVHGEPTWSFLWRKVLVPVRDAGYRCIAPDLPGFGRSDKPVEIDWYTYDRHTTATGALLEELDVRGATMGPRGCLNDPGDAVIAAYEAPFPTAQAKAGARAFPLFLPTNPDMPAAAAGRSVLQALRVDTRPKLVLWADSDAVLPLSTGERFAAALGTEVAQVIDGAGHFLQEDAGPRLGALIADWLRAG